MLQAFIADKSAKYFKFNFMEHCMIRDFFMR